MTHGLAHLHVSRARTTYRQAQVHVSRGPGHVHVTYHQVWFRVMQPRRHPLV